MPVLTSAQRNSLEKAVIQARKLSETGAHHALQALAVTEAEPFKHQSPEQRALRNRLRSKGRLLGDKLEASGKQGIDHLAYELAYEYWHKMLFAQFLEANGLLMHPSGVAVTMEECEELAKDDGYANKWAAAAAYASKELPAIFRVEDPLLQVEFAPNDRIELETLLEKLDHTIYTADDALGWVYQFWQSKSKAAINASGDKIDGEKLPAVTQLFTEPYMVHFLIDNTLGAWWVSRHPGTTPPVKFEYLRLLEDGTPAAGKFEGWPNTTREVTTLDPCMGSGHFVVSLFAVLVRLRMAEEKLTKEEATDKVITENLHGLELDPRCTQLAAFNLALAAWKFCGKYKPLPEMNLACSGVAPKGKKEDWVLLVGNVKDVTDKTRLEGGMRMLYDHFQLAPELGSLLDPTTIKPDAFTASFEELRPVLTKALQREADQDEVERGVIAAGIAKAGQLLSQQYTLQITNVPYLSRGKQDKVMADYCSRHYPEAKGDLATVFLQRMLKSCRYAGVSSCVVPQDWIFKGIYKKLRQELLKSNEWKLLGLLGPKAFQTPMYDFNVMLFIIQKANPDELHNIGIIDVTKEVSSSEKDKMLKAAKVLVIRQLENLRKPDSRITIGESSSARLLSDFAEALVGLQTSDDSFFVINFWEVQWINKSIWEYLQGSPNRRKIDAGMSTLVKWEEGKGVLLSLPTAYPTKGLKALGKRGIAIHRMGNIFPFYYAKERFHQNVAVIIPYDERHFEAIMAYCSSSQYSHEVRKIDKALKVTNATLVKVPFDLDYWQNVSSTEFPKGLPKPYTDDATQWLYHGHPQKTETPLQVSFARLLGYRWPAESDEEMELAEEARGLIHSIKAFDHLSDEDGILCIPAVNGEPSAADSLRSYLMKVWGKEWNNNTVEELLKKEGASKSNLEEYLREEFFVQHCKVFQNRPFIWHIWDGRKDGFSAFVNFHKLTKENLQKLIFTYLGDWIHQCEGRLKAGRSGADGQLNAAKKLKENLELILAGEPPYDIFVRWKKLEEQPIGWDPDLNDGVRLNIRPFIMADVLRKKPNIKWGIDRGKNPPGSPWGVDRDNDRHLSLAEKQEARLTKKKK